jgi:hypothetical protein
MCTLHQRQENCRKNTFLVGNMNFQGPSGINMIQRDSSRGLCWRFHYAGVKVSFGERGHLGQKFELDLYRII